MKPDRRTVTQPSPTEIRMFETLSAIEKSVSAFQAQSLVASERVAGATESMAGAISSVRALHQRLAESDRLQTKSLELAVATMRDPDHAYGTEKVLRDLDSPIRSISKNTELFRLCCETQRNVLHKIEKSVSGIARLDEIALLLKQLLHTLQEPPTQDPDSPVIPEPSAPTDKYAASVDVLELPTRVRNGLLGSDIRTVLELKRTSEIELLKIPNMGWKSLLDIYRALYRYEVDGKPTEVQS